MKVTVVLSAPEHHKTSHMPYALRRMYFGQDGLSRLIDMSGYPNNGGQHTCTISGERTDIIAWLDLFLEEYPDTKPEIDTLKKHIRHEFIKSPSGHCRIVLADFTRQHVHNGKFISRRWFWHEGCEPEHLGDNNV
jgi:hypothetical protein